MSESVQPTTPSQPATAKSYGPLALPSGQVVYSDETLDSQSFMDMLTDLTANSPTTDPYLQTDNTPTNLTQDVPTLKARVQKSKPAQASEVAVTSAVEPARAAVQIESGSVEDLDEMVLDFSALEALDMRYVQQCLNPVPYPLLPLSQNLSPSLLQLIPQAHYTSLGISKGLNTVLQKAYTQQKPVRITLDENVTVILRLAANGQVSAEFLPNTQAADVFFRQNMYDLRQRLESKHLPYGQLSVRDWSQQQNQKQQQQSQQQT